MGVSQIWGSNFGVPIIAVYIEVPLFRETTLYERSLADTGQSSALIVWGSYTLNPRLDPIQRGFGGLVFRASTM